MTDWTDILDDLADACVTSFDDDVTLPGGAVVQGIFDPIGERMAPLYPETGLALRLSRQANPVVWLRAVDVMGLAADALVAIRGRSYRVTDFDEDALGLIAVGLRLETADAQSPPEEEPWR